MALSSNLGFPRIGPKRELKKGLEDYWGRVVSESKLLETGKEIRRYNWRIQKEAGLDFIPSNDFSFYDHVLDTAFMTGAIPRRFSVGTAPASMESYFAMARGGNDGAHPMEMTKWFDSNYHYIVPEFEARQEFSLTSAKPVEEFLEAKSLGIHTRPVLLGPVSFLLLGKSVGCPALDLLDGLLPVYEELLKRLNAAGVVWVQMDEPILSLDCSANTCSAIKRAYKRFSVSAPGLKLLVAAYYAPPDDNLSTMLHLPVHALHFDLVRGFEHLDAVLDLAPKEMSLSLGVVDGRNIWRTDLGKVLGTLKTVRDLAGPDRVMVAPSCPMMHVPVDLELEDELDPELKGWLAFAKQKVREIATLSRALNEGELSVKEAFEESDVVAKSRRTSSRIVDSGVRRRVEGATAAQRKSPFPVRKRIQQELLDLPSFPCTTVGSFPQTRELRSMRAAFKSGKLGREEYDVFIRNEIEKTIRFQEDAELDVLVHGEYERGDMVEYFAGFLRGMAATKNGWVQSYGSRFVKPPIIYGDISRTGEMTVELTRFAQSLTKKPVKGMLTGPVTILQWSFVRDDQPHEETCRQIALAIREEVNDLEREGIRIIQIDEPAFREGLPLRRSDWRNYLSWAAACFRLASSGVRDETQIHTHMCYANFNDIIDTVAALDADVISIESSRSRMELLEAFKDFQYPNDIGPGIYDVHSPLVPAAEEMEELLKKASHVLLPEQIWVNPDCGLKTRRWEEVIPAISEMVAAAKALRTEVHK